jgi:hypothetical protein
MTRRSLHTGGAVNERQRRSARLGFGLGIPLAIAIMIPALSREPSDEAQEDTGRAMAEAAGCDLSQSEVAVSEGVFDYYLEPGTGRPVGASSSLKEAVLGISDSLADDGAVFSREELEAAAASAVTDTDPIEVRLEGVVIFVDRWDDHTYVVRGQAMCA